MTERLQRWSMDFMRDMLADGRGFRTLNIVDDGSRECPAIEVDRSIPGARVVRVLDRLKRTWGLPHEIVIDNVLTAEVKGKQVLQRKHERQPELGGDCDGSKSRRELVP